MFFGSIMKTNFSDSRTESILVPSLTLEGGNQNRY